MMRLVMLGGVVLPALMRALAWPGISFFAFSEHVSRDTGCRQFVGESRLSCGDLPPGPVPLPVSAVAVAVPHGVTVHVQLNAPIDSGTSKTGVPMDAVCVTMAPLPGKDS